MVLSLPTEAAKPPFQVPGSKFKRGRAAGSRFKVQGSKLISWSNKHESISYLSVLNSQFSAV